MDSKQVAIVGIALVLALVVGGGQFVDGGLAEGVCGGGVTFLIALLVLSLLTGGSRRKRE